MPEVDLLWHPLFTEPVTAPTPPDWVGTGLPYQGTGECVHPIDWDTGPWFAFYPIQPSIHSSSATQPLYPVSQLYDLDIDVRYRSTTLPAWGILNTAGLGPLFIAVFESNFRNLRITASDDPAGTVNVITGTVPMIQDLNTKMRKVYFCIHEERSYLRWDVDVQTTDTGVNYAEMGTIVIFRHSTLWRSLIRHVLPWQRSIQKPGRSIQLAAGGTRKSVYGRARVSLQMPVSVDSPQEPALLQLADVDEQQQFVLVENLRYPRQPPEPLDRSAVYLVRKIGPYQGAEAGYLFDAQFTFEEQ